LELEVAKGTGGGVISSGELIAMEVMVMRWDGIRRKLLGEVVAGAVE
jgi:hypothetical protein